MTKTTWEHLVTEVTVKFDDLSVGDEAEEDRITPIYEYVNEAKEVIDWCKSKASDELTVPDLSNYIVKVFERTIEHTYESESFDQIAEFIIGRVKLFKKQNLI